MTAGLRQTLISLPALCLAIAVVIVFTSYPARIGELPLLLRAALLNLAVASALIAAYPLNPPFRGRPGLYAVVVCLPALLPAVFYFQMLLPRQADGGLTGSQIGSSLITDSSSNGIIEVGFAYPIYTPTIQLHNRGLYTRQVSVFLRMTDADGEEALFRAVRQRVPQAGLNVEATVQGMLSENGGYLFNPLQLPPGRIVTGRVVFVITNVEDGRSLSETLGRSQQASFELRDPETGSLLDSFPAARL